MGMNLAVNGVAIEAETIEREAMLFDGAEQPLEAARRSLAVRELLLQRAHDLGMEATGDDPESTGSLIEELLDVEVTVPEPTEAECRRHYQSHLEQYTAGELLEARHILIAVTPGAPVARLRARAESLLAQLRADPALFADRARELSNCPSGQHGGKLGQVERGQFVPEFDKAIFGTRTTGVLPALVQTRYGFHVVSIVRRLPGRQLTFEQVRQRIAASLSERVQARALAQYIRVLAAEADIQGIDLDAAASPLLQ
jgi:peptidyl-prolyl cis-trans isomerase C